MHAHISSSGIRHWLRVPICSLFILFPSFIVLQAAPPAELTALQQQYEKAVLAPAAAAKAELDAKFITALGNAVTAAKQAGKE